MDEIKRMGIAATILKQFLCEGDNYGTWGVGLRSTEFLNAPFAHF